MGVQAVVVPGRRRRCQAAVDGTHLQPDALFEELQKGTDPARIIELLSVDPAFQSRQFGILDLQGRSAGHSGLGNGYVSQDVQGQVPGTGIYYSIQGNILRPGQVVPNAVQAFLKTSGALTDRRWPRWTRRTDRAATALLVPALADRWAHAGHCLRRPHSTVAYILMAEPTDASGDSHNNGKYAMYITVSQPGPDKGPGQVRPGENLNPVKTLRQRYDAWRRTQPASFR